MMTTISAVDHSNETYAITSILIQHDADIDLISNIKTAAKEFIQTERGKEVYKNNHNTFNWNNIMDIPDKTFKKYGIQIISMEQTKHIHELQESLV